MQKLLTFLIFLGGPEILDEDSLAQNIESVLVSVGEEHTRNPGGNIFNHPTSFNRAAMDSSGLAKMKEKFAFLRDYSDSFIEQAGLELLITAESVSRKLSDPDRSRKAEDKLLANRDNLKPVWLEGGEDNRLDMLHRGRFLPGAVCSSQKLWLSARDSIGAKGHLPLSSYDMGSIGLGGAVSAKGWVEIHDPSSTSLSIKLFNLSGSVKQSSGSKDPDFPELEDLTELINALRALRGLCHWFTLGTIPSTLLSPSWSNLISALQILVVLTNRPLSSPDSSTLCW